MARIQQEQVWAGSEASLQAVLTAEEDATTFITAGGQVVQSNVDPGSSRLLEVSDGIGVISIRGPLNNDSGFFNEIFGMTGYPEIRDALVTAANDTNIKQILLDIDSGGGAVSGVADTGRLIRTINDNIKPVTTYSEGTMASAAYWLGSSAGEVHIGKSAVVGSIGIISTHMERSKQLKDAGIGVTVVRAGKYKALANSVEPLSEEGKAQIQALVDSAYTVFVDHVAEMRGQTYAHTDEHMAQGREFVGQDSVNVGLVDSIKTFDDVMGKLKAKAIDASTKFMDNRVKPKMSSLGVSGTQLSGESDMGMKQALTEQDIAALAAGALALQAGTAPDDQAEAAAAEAAAAEAAAAEAAAAAQKPDNSSATVQLLNAQLKEKDEALIQAAIKINKLEEHEAEMSATNAPLLKIACQSIGNMLVALGGSAGGLEGMTAAQAVAEHARVTEQFASKFKVGGVAAVSADQSSQGKPQPTSSRHKALVNAARYIKKEK